MAERRIRVLRWDGTEYDVDEHGRRVSAIRQARPLEWVCVVCQKPWSRCDCRWERQILEGGRR